MIFDPINIHAIKLLNWAVAVSSLPCNLPRALVKRSSA